MALPIYPPVNESYRQRKPAIRSKKWFVPHSADKNEAKQSKGSDSNPSAVSISERRIAEMYIPTQPTWLLPLAKDSTSPRVSTVPFPFSLTDSFLCSMIWLQTIRIVGGGVFCYIPQTWKTRTNKFDLEKLRKSVNCPTVHKLGIRFLYQPKTTE